MLWLKRNLFLAVSGLITFVLMAIGGYYLMTSYQASKSIESELEEKKERLDKLSSKNPYPSAANIKIVQDEITKLQGNIGKLRAYFTPLPVPMVAGTGKDFGLLLDNTLAELHKKANQLNVLLPSKTYAFSFEAQRNKLSFRGGFPGLPEQLADIKAISTILLDSKINRLVNVRRTPVSGDDEGLKTTADYHDLRMVREPLTGAAIRPYQFEFECFSPELASILTSLYQSKFAFHVKSVMVEPATGSPVRVVTPPPTPTASPANLPNARFRGRMPVAGGPPRPPGTGGTGQPDAKTVLAEHLLKVVLYVEVIHPGPGT